MMMHKLYQRNNATAELTSRPLLVEWMSKLAMADEPQNQSQADPGLRRMMKWVFGALVLTVLLAVLVVEFTLHWFGHP